jgi:hypothetical protein
LKPFPLKSRTRWCSLCPLLFNIVLEYILKAVRQEEEIKEIKIGNKVVPLFADDMILLLKDLKNSTQKFLDTMKSFFKVAGYQINLQKSVDFLYTNHEQLEEEYKKTIAFTIASKKLQIPGNKLNKGYK